MDIEVALREGMVVVEEDVMVDQGGTSLHSQTLPEASHGQQEVEVPCFEKQLLELKIWEGKETMEEHYFENHLVGDEGVWEERKPGKVTEVSCSENQQMGDGEVWEKMQEGKRAVLEVPCSVNQMTGDGEFLVNMMEDNVVVVVV